MFPVEYYRTVQADRHARIGRLARRARRSTAPAPTVGRTLTVPGPSGRVLLSPEGVTRIDTPVAAGRR